MRLGPVAGTEVEAAGMCGHEDELRSGPVPQTEGFLNLVPLVSNGARKAPRC